MSIAFLPSEQYTFTDDSLSWGYCRSHWHAWNAVCGCTFRAVVQLTFVVFECVYSIIGEIISLVELCFAWIHYSFFQLSLHQALDSIESAPSIKLAEISHRNLYFTSNERNIPEICGRLAAIPAKGNVVVGVSGLHNLRFFISRPDSVDHLIVIDPDLAQRDLWNIVIHGIKESDGPKKAEEIILNKIETTFTLETLEKYGKIQSRFTNQSILRKKRRVSKLIKEVLASGWQKIKKAVSEDKIIYFSLNLGDQIKRGVFAKVLESQNCTIDTLYVSNVHFKRWLGEAETLEGINVLLGNKDAILLIVADGPATAQVDNQKDRESIRNITHGHYLACTVGSQFHRIPVE